MRRDRLLGLSLTLLCGLAPSMGMAEHQPSPLTELRLASESQADVEPEIVPQLHPAQPLIASGVSKVGVEGASEQSAIKTAIRGAIREDVAREISNRAALGASPVGKSATKELTGSEHGLGDSGVSRAAALQSQQVRQNQVVSQAQKAARGQTNGKLILPPAAGSAARQMLR